MTRACVVWVGRHTPLPAQLDFFKEKLGSYTLMTIDFVETYQKLIEMVMVLKQRGCGRIIVTGTMPLGIYKMLADEQERHGFEVWWPDMMTIASDVDEEIAKMLQQENPERRGVQCYRDGSCKVVEFVDFKRLKRVILVFEDV